MTDGKYPGIIIEIREDKLMPVPRCDQCRFWKQWGPDWGHCELAADREIEGIAPEDRRFRVTADLDRSALTTRADFGCIQYERKP